MDPWLWFDTARHLKSGTLDAKGIRSVTKILLPKENKKMQPKLREKGGVL